MKTSIDSFPFGATRIFGESGDVMFQLPPQKGVGTRLLHVSAGDSALTDMGELKERLQQVIDKKVSDLTPLV